MNRPILYSEINIDTRLPNMIQWSYFPTYTEKSRLNVRPAGASIGDVWNRFQGTVESVAQSLSGYVRILGPIGCRQNTFDRGEVKLSKK